MIPTPRPPPPLPLLPALPLSEDEEPIEEESSDATDDDPDIEEAHEDTRDDRGPIEDRASDEDDADLVESETDKEAEPLMAASTSASEGCIFEPVFELGSPKGRYRDCMLSDLLDDEPLADELGPDCSSPNGMMVFRG